MRKKTEHKFGGATVIVSRPDLTEAEKVKRERILASALEQFGKAMHQVETAKAG